MSVTAQEVAGTWRLGVLGDLAAPATQGELVRALEQRGARPVELSFYDARTLPGPVLEKLLDLVADGAPLKLYAYHTHLLHHLLRLHLPALGVFVPVETVAAPVVAAVALGGSADSLDKLLAIVEALPRANVAVFVVQHVLDDQPSYLDRLLQSRTDYAVVMPQHLTAIVPGTIYVAPPGHQMKVAHGQVYLTTDQVVNFARPSIDVLFTSVAEEYRERALAVLLCGFGHDGVDGLQTVKRHGGCVLVERSSDCAASALPDAGIASRAFDHVLSLPELRCFVASAVAGRGPGLPPRLIELLLEAVLSRHGYDFRNYQRSTVERRLENLRGQLRAADFFALQREILTDPEVFERLFLELSIGVTAFFRHPAQFQLLREKVLPYLESCPSIRIWSAGCANGREAYSLAMLLDELGLLDRAQIFATDINPYLLDEGKSGLYPVEEGEEAQRNYQASGGQGSLDKWLVPDRNCLKVAPRLRKHVLFYSHSLTHDGPFQEFQLIVCRNVLIYFHPVLQRRVLELFAGSLHRDGFLLLGPSEGGGTGDGRRFFAPCVEKGELYRWGPEGGA